MLALRSRTRVAAAALAACILAANAAQASTTCPDEQTTEQVPQDTRLCESLEDAVRHPSKLPLNEYEAKLSQYLGAMCHRNIAAGWAVDKRIRDTGPWVGTYQNRKWTGKYSGTHAPVLVWYSKDMVEWLRANRPHGRPAPDNPPPVADGAMMIKEMYPPPAAACQDVPWQHLLPVSQASAVMVRDSTASHDGWFWGWYGWKGSSWQVDWPAPQTSPTLRMGFGPYCTNCHASAESNQTFAVPQNILGEDGEPLVFLSQNFFLDPSWQSLQTRIAQAGNKDAAAGPNDPAYSDAFKRIFSSLGGLPDRKTIVMPPETYDNVWAKAGGPTAASQFLTSDQCIGCHSAGGTGIQFDMTEPGTDDKLVNISPYGTWRGSPMGLAGRDPIFFAQLASETDTFHKNSKPMVENTCLGCHGIQGERQFGIDTPSENGACKPFSREMVDAIPYAPEMSPVDALAHREAARYGALARDGISCMSCHRMVLGDKATAEVRDQPQNKCVAERQQALNPGLSGFAATFTSSFFVGAPDKLYGPFQDPKRQSMKNALGIEPAHSATITSSEVCGSCHTVHLPIMRDTETLGRVYEQTTYPEWAFSDYRTGDSPDGPLESNSGPRAQSCQGCHMPNKDALGNPYRSKIASIQEYSNFPQAEHVLPRQEIDLKTRAGFAKHTLVGLNVFLLKMAWQFPDILGIRRTDPMLTETGIDSIPTAEGAMLDQAVNRTATVTVGDVRRNDDTLSARVTVINRVGHKFPSGVGFRRVFIEFSVLDEDGKTLWSSGRTDENGIILGADKKPLKSELWWEPDCSRRIEPLSRLHQPHYAEITSQDQVQIFEELVAAPPEGPAPVCGIGATPQGPLTTSFLSQCVKVKDNRLLPSGFLPLEQRVRIAEQLGAHRDLAEDTAPVGVGDDPDYQTGGSDSLVYKVKLPELSGKKPAAVQATLYYQATPPYFLQDRFCTSQSTDTKRLYYLTGKLGLTGTQAENWKLRVVTSGPVTVP